MRIYVQALDRESSEFARNKVLDFSGRIPIAGEFFMWPDGDKERYYEVKLVVHTPLDDECGAQLYAVEVGYAVIESSVVNLLKAH